MRLPHGTYALIQIPTCQGPSYLERVINGDQENRRKTLMEKTMMNALKSGKLAVSVSLLAIAGIFFNAPAYAAECPADQAGTDVRTTGEMSPAGVTDEELSAIDLSQQIEGIHDRRLRFRKLVIQPGGVVPWHDHSDRPALIFTAEGEITEFRSDCAVGLVHQAGDISTETLGLKHWWKNESKAPAVLYAADVKHDQ